MPHNLEERVAKHDAEITALAQAVSTVNASVNELRGELSSSISRILTRFDEQTTRHNEATKPQWGTIIAAIGVGILVITAIGTSFISPIATSMGAHDRTLTERGVIIEKMQDRLREVESKIMIAASERMALKQQLHEVSEYGSPITRERLAIIESQLLLGSSKLVEEARKKDVKP